MQAHSHIIYMATKMVVNALKYTQKFFFAQKNYLLGFYFFVKTIFVHIQNKFLNLSLEKTFFCEPEKKNIILR